MYRSVILHYKIPQEFDYLEFLLPICLLITFAGYTDLTSGALEEVSRMLLFFPLKLLLVHSYTVISSQGRDLYLVGILSKTL